MENDWNMSAHLIESSLKTHGPESTWTINRTRLKIIGRRDSILGASGRKGQRERFWNKGVEEGLKSSRGREHETKRKVDEHRLRN